MHARAHRTWTKRLRLKELAAHLDLSITTVSRALAGYSDVSEETRRRVREAADAFGYVPNQMGRMLVSGRSNFVGMLLPIHPHELVDPYLADFLAGLAGGLTQRGRDLFLATVPTGQDDLAVLQRVVESRRADAVVLYRLTCEDPRVAFLIERGVPFVAHGRTLAGTDAYSWLDTDGEGAFHDLGRKLVALGHRHFAMLAPTKDFTYAFLRRRGFERALAEAGLPPPDVLTVPLGDAAAMARAAAQLINRDPRPTAVIGLKDQLALAVLDEARREGIAVPQALTVVGFDDTPVAAYADPPLTTFSQNIAEGAAMIAAMVVERLEKGEAGIAGHLVEPRFVPRASHGPAPAGAT